MLRVFDFAVEVAVGFVVTGAVAFLILVVMDLVVPHL